MKNLLLVFAFIPVLLFSQTRKQRKALEAQKKADQQIINNLKSHIQFFEKNAQVRNPVLKNDDIAAEYITDQFKTLGLKPKETNGYIRHFEINEGKQINPATFLKVNGTLLAVKKDYFPFSFSASKSVNGMPAMALKERGVPWFSDLKSWLDENTKNPDFNIIKIIRKEAERAAARGATALFIYNSTNLTDNVYFNNKDSTSALSIPVIYITSDGYSKYFTDPSQMLDVELNVALAPSIKNASNVEGFIDNGAATNVVIAASYNCFYQNDKTTADKKITTGSDMSGTAMLIELARMLSSSKAKHNNYTFIAYTAEDTLVESNEWIKNAAVNTGDNYIINLNNAGRYNEDTKLLIKSYGISPEWIEAIGSVSSKNLEVSFDSSALYNKDFLPVVKVPILNVFTSIKDSGINTSADNSKINYEAELQIDRFIFRLIEATDNKGKLAFFRKEVK